MDCPAKTVFGGNQAYRIEKKKLSVKHRISQFTGLVLKSLLWLNSLGFVHKFPCSKKTGLYKQLRALLIHFRALDKKPSFVKISELLSTIRALVKKSEFLTPVFLTKVRILNQTPAF